MRQAMAPGVAAQASNSLAFRLVTVQVPSPLANATGTVFQPCPPTRAMSVRPRPLNLPVTTFTPDPVAQPANWGAVELWIVQVPSPLANATGTVFQPFSPTRAMSVRPLPLKLPVTTFTPDPVAQPANSGAVELWIVQVPSPLANATGTVFQPCPPTRAMSVRPLPLKLPVTTFTPDPVAQPANSGAVELWIVQVPSPLANATGTVFQPCPPTRAMSVRPLPLKLPVTTFTPDPVAQPANSAAVELWIVQGPSPLANATGTVFQPCPPTRAMSVRPLPLKLPVTTSTPAPVAQPANSGAVASWTVRRPSP